MVVSVYITGAQVNIEKNILLQHTEIPMNPGEEWLTKTNIIYSE